MDDQFDAMSAQFKTLEEVTAYSQAQYRTTVELSKKITRLENENKELKKSLQDSVPKDPTQVNNLLIEAATDEEYICRVQIAELKRVCGEREFTLDESKRLDIFVKILLALKNKNEKEVSKAQAPLSNDELMALMKDLA